MHFTWRSGRMALAIATAVAITGLFGSGPVGAVADLGAPDLKAASDSGVSSTDDYTNATALTFTVTGAAENDVVELWRGVTKVATGTAGTDGALELTDPATVPEGPQSYTLVRGADTSLPTVVTVDRTAPVSLLAPAAPDLDAASDSGKSSTDNVTKVKTPSFTQGAVPLGADAIELLRNGASIPSGGNAITTGASVTEPTALADATYTYASRGVDLAGNAGPASTNSPNLSVRIDTSGLVFLLLNAASDTGRSSSDAYTTGLAAAAGNIYAEIVVALGLDTGTPINWTHTDPNGVTTNLNFPPDPVPIPATSLVPTTATPGATVLTDILSLFVGQAPTNGKWTYAVIPGTPLDDAGNAYIPLPMSMVIDTTPPALPVVDLDAASDMGSSDSDNVTQWNAQPPPPAATVLNNTLKFTVTSEVESTVDFYRDGVSMGPAAQLVAGTSPIPSQGVAVPTGTVPFTDTGSPAYTLSAWHGMVAVATDKAGNTSSGNLPVYVDVDAPPAPLQLDLITEDDHGAATDDNITNVAMPRFNVTGAEDGAVVELTACEGPGCTLFLSLAPFVTRSTRTAKPIGSALAADIVVIGRRVGNGVIQADPNWWTNTAVGQLDNYTAGGGPVLSGNPANTSWRFNVRQRDLSGRLGATFSQDLSVVIDATPLPAPASPDLVVASDTGPSDSDNVTAAISPTFNVASGQGRVELLRDGQVVAVRTAAGEISDPGPLGNGAYTYTTRATDTAGNVSALSAPLTVVVEHSGGYWLVASDGGVFAMGNAPFFGSLGGEKLNAPVISVIPTPTHNGYWLLAKDGGVFSFGDAGFYGSTGDMTLNSPIVGMVPSKTGHGYWLFAEDGGVFSFGDAGFFGSPASSSPTSKVVAMRATPDGNGYWLVTAAGKVYSFGSATSLAGVDDGPLNSPIVGIAVTPTGRGLWLAGADGGIFTLGDAGFFGSMGGERVNSPIIGIESLATGGGYWELAGDGGVFAFGGAPFLGSTGGMRLNRPIVGMGLA